MFLEIFHAGRYTYQQRGSQTAHAVFISLHLSGVEKNNVYSPDGTLIMKNTEPKLALLPPGFRCDFSYSEARENFVIICNIPSLIYDSDAGICKIQQHDSILNIPIFLQCSPVDILRFKEIFQRIIKLLTTPTPANRFMAEQLTGILIGELAIGGKPLTDTAKNPSLAEQLKNKLDNDTNFAENINRHCQQMGYTQAHLRRLFEKEYGISPGEYRLQCRNEKILQLLAAGNISYKEISFVTGMKNVTHLNAFIRKRWQMTPGELQKKLLQTPS